MWRRMRAQLILSGEHEMNADLDEIAYKMMADRRDELKGSPGMTAEELDAENALFDKQGRGGAGGGKQ